MGSSDKERRDGDKLPLFFWFSLSVTTLLGRALMRLGERRAYNNITSVAFSSSSASLSFRCASSPFPQSASARPTTHHANSRMLHRTPPKILHQSLRVEETERDRFRFGEEVSDTRWTTVSFARLETLHASTECPGFRLPPHGTRLGPRLSQWHVQFLEHVARSPARLAAAKKRSWQQLLL